MGEIQELKQMLRAHMEESARGQLEIKEAIAEIKVHGEYARETITTHSQDIDKLKSAHNKQKGVIWVLSLIGLGGLIELIKNLAK